MKTAMRVGHGYDAHRLTEGRPLILGGVTVPFDRGLLGHSDADVLTHAVMDAFLGALALGTIGDLFPDNDPAYKDACSLHLLKIIWRRVTDLGWGLGNLDATLVAQAPKLAAYLPKMQKALAEVLECEPSCISIKATTEENMGFTGSGEGVSAHAVCLLQKSDD